MPYVDSHGRVHASPPLLQRLVLAVRSLYLAVALFLSTLFSVRRGPECSRAVLTPSPRSQTRPAACHHLHHSETQIAADATSEGQAVAVEGPVSVVLV